MTGRPTALLWCEPCPGHPDRKGRRSIVCEIDVEILAEEVLRPDVEDRVVSEWHHRGLPGNPLVVHVGPTLSLGRRRLVALTELL